MKALLFDPCAGASGDMIMASLLDMGADPDAVCRAVESVGCTLEVTRQEKCHITATKAGVISERRYQSLGEAVSILKASSLEGKALQKALAALNTLAEAESRVHGVAKEEAHFHEVGALDALADIVGSCAARESLSVEKVFSRPVSVGGGYAHSSHGLLPVPGPAALEILRSHKMPWQGGPVQEELLTPTGAALLAVIVDEFVPDFPPMRAERVGYGAGKREMIMPNVLRAIAAETIFTPAGGAAAVQDHGRHGDRVVQLETNVDDVTGEVMGYLIEKLMQAGALDVSVLPAMMKKGRAGFVVRAIARHEETELLAGIIIRETGSLGVRIFPGVHRLIAEREQRPVQVEMGGQIIPVRVKVSRMEGKIISVKPEYEDCKRIAKEADLPLRTVIKKVEEAGWKTEDF